MKITQRQLRKIIKESMGGGINLVEQISHLIDKEMTIRTGDEFWYDSYENIEIIHNILDSVKDTYRGT